MKRRPGSAPAAAKISDGTGLVLVGAGGHALVVAEAAVLAGFAVLGAIDDAPDAAALRLLRLNHLGPMKAAKGKPRPGSYILALGDIALRRKLIARGAEFGTPTRVVHPHATVHPSARVGPGAYVGPRAVVHTFADVGPHAIVNTGAIVEHECILGENCHIAPGAVLGGRAKVGTDTLIGMGALVLPGVVIGKGCTVGAGAVVIRDVPGGATVAGVPARRR